MDKEKRKNYMREYMREFMRQKRKRLKIAKYEARLAENKCSKDSTTKKK